MEKRLNACKQTDCKVSETGKCLESLELEACPHFYLMEEGANDDTMAEPSRGRTPDKFKLFEGEHFDIKNLNIITSQVDCKYIFVLGDYDAGKTTLVTSLYEMFQKGPINDHLLFSSSLTQMGFERRCYLARVESEVEKADTERTKNPEFNFLHLGIKEKGKETENGAHLIISDVSGEKIGSARNSSVSMEELSMLKYAHRIVYMIDGEILANKKLRAATLQDAAMFITMAIDSGIFNSQTKLNIAVSKWDLLKDLADFNFESSFTDFFQPKFKHRLGILEYSRIAARPLESLPDIPMGFGIYEMVKNWITEDPAEEAILEKVELQSSRMFNHYFCPTN